MLVDRLMSVETLVVALAVLAGVLLAPTGCAVSSDVDQVAIEAPGGSL